MDFAHLALMRGDPPAFAPGGVWHLLLEVAACAPDEAGCADGGVLNLRLGHFGLKVGFA